MRQLKKKVKWTYLANTWRYRAAIDKLIKPEYADFLKEKKHSDKIFFVIGNGRSGTQLITSVLNLHPKVSVYHEPNHIEDVELMNLLKEDPVFAEEYFTVFRNYQVAKRWKESKSEYYGEVNGNLRYLADTLTEQFPNTKLFMNYRDGRGVIRSIMGWNQLFYGPKSKGGFNVLPKQTSPYYKKFNQMNQFEKICWLWMDPHQKLMKQVDKTNWIKLEDFVINYEYANSSLFHPLGIDIEKDEFENKAKKPSKNKTKTYGFPAWKDWSVDQKKQFIQICGATMTELGYSI